VPARMMRRGVAGGGPGSASDARSTPEGRMRDNSGVGTSSSSMQRLSSRWQTAHSRRGAGGAAHMVASPNAA